MGESGVTDPVMYTIVPFNDSYRQAFIDFNTGWITTYFKLEPHDLEAFKTIDEAIKQGAQIFFALENGQPVATCMATPMEADGTWELCKLASDLTQPHPGAGSAVFKAAMDWALSHGASRLYLISNTKLTPALHIYEKFGFTAVPLEHCDYERGDCAFEFYPQK